MKPNLQLPDNFYLLLPRHYGKITVYPVSSLFNITDVRSRVTAPSTINSILSRPATPAPIAPSEIPFVVFAPSKSGPNVTVMKRAEADSLTGVGSRIFKVRDIKTEIAQRR